MEGVDAAMIIGRDGKELEVKLKSSLGNGNTFNSARNNNNILVGWYDFWRAITCFIIGMSRWRGAISLGDQVILAIQYPNT